MGLKEQIELDLKAAMKSKNANDLRALRAIKAAILLAETEKGAVGNLTEEADMRLLTKAAKQRKESAEIFTTQGRKDLADKELAELEVISRYLPDQMSELEIEAQLKTMMVEVGASGMSDMGRLMAEATRRLAGKADGATISHVARKLLS